MYRVIPEDDSSLEVSSPRDQQSPILPPGAPQRKETDKTARRKVLDVGLVSSRRAFNSDRLVDVT